MSTYKESKYFKADLLYTGRYKTHKHIYPSNTHNGFPEKKLFSSKSTIEKEWEWAGAHLVVHSQLPRALSHGLLERPWAIFHISITNYNQCNI